MAEHAGLGFDSADAPAHDTQAVDHGGVRIGAHQRVGISQHRRLLVIAEHHRSEILEVYLVHDAGIRRHDAEVLEGGLTPAQKRVSLLVALEFQQRIETECVLRSELVHLHGVVDDQVGGNQRVRELRVGAHGFESVAHGGEVDDARHAGEILEQYARGPEVDFLGRSAGVPLRDVLDISVADSTAVFKAQQVFEEDFNGIRNS